MAFEFKQDATTDTMLLQTGRTHEGKNIVIAMDTVIMENRLVDILTSSSYNVDWCISKKEDSDEIVLKAKVNNRDYIYDLDTDNVVKELAGLIKTNKSLESCNSLMSVYNDANTDIFNCLLEEEGMIIGSNNVHKGYLKIYHENKLIGTASRFMLTSSNQLCICEYVGKPINREMQLRYNLILPETTISFRWRSELTGYNEFDLFNPEVVTLGYFGAVVNVASVKEETSKIPDITYLNTTNNYTTSQTMNAYILENNSEEDITLYKISMKPKTELINVNQFMLREFLV